MKSLVSALSIATLLGAALFGVATLAADDDLPCYDKEVGDDCTEADGDDGTCEEDDDDTLECVAHDDGCDNDDDNDSDDNGGDNCVSSSGDKDIDTDVDDVNVACGSVGSSGIFMGFLALLALRRRSR